MTDNKDAVIRFRIPKRDQELFYAYCKRLGRVPSAILRDYVENLALNQYYFEEEETKQRYSLSMKKKKD